MYFNEQFKFAGTVYSNVEIDEVSSRSVYFKGRVHLKLYVYIIYYITYIYYIYTILYILYYIYILYSIYYFIYCKYILHI